MFALIDNRWPFEIVKISPKGNSVELVYFYNKQALPDFPVYCRNLVFQQQTVSIQSKNFFGFFKMQCRSESKPVRRGSFRAEVDDWFMERAFQNYGDIVYRIGKENLPEFYCTHARGIMVLNPLKENG